MDHCPDAHFPAPFILRVGSRCTRITPLLYQWGCFANRLAGSGVPTSLLSIASFPPKTDAQVGGTTFSLRDALGFNRAKARNPAAMPNLPPLEQQHQQFQMAPISASAKNPQMPQSQIDDLTGARFMEMAGAPPAAGGRNQGLSSPLDPSGAFDQMHSGWVPKRPETTSSGIPSLATADRFDGLTGAGFMALSDPGSESTPLQMHRRL